MTDNVAVLAGFTKEVYGEYSCMALHLLVRPDTALDTRFRAWDMDLQEFTMVNGYLADFNEC